MPRIPPEWVTSQQDYRRWLAELSREAEGVARSRSLFTGRRRKARYGTRTERIVLGARGAP